MALIWVDPFDQYGANAALIPSFGYSAAAVAGFVAGRTGGANSAVSIFTGAQELQRTLDVALAGAGASLGVGYAVNPQVAPAATSFQGSGIRLGWDGANSQISFVINANLGISVYSPTVTLIGATPNNMLPLTAWTWVEVKATLNNGGVNTGSCEVRINGVTQLIINGINLPNPLVNVYLGGFANNITHWVDDFIVWDSTGAKNNNFMGDRHLVWVVPNANDALQDFVPSAGNAFNCVNQVPPVDTTYIEGGAAGNISEFAKGGIGNNSNDIAALVCVGRLFKTDAGAATARLGINSSGVVLNSPDINPTVAPGVWYREIVELNPNGNTPWVHASADAAQIRITRTV